MMVMVCAETGPSPPIWDAPPPLFRGRGLRSWGPPGAFVLLSSALEGPVRTAGAGTAGPQTVRRSLLAEAPVPPPLPSPASSPRPPIHNRCRTTPRPAPCSTGA